MNRSEAGKLGAKKSAIGAAQRAHERRALYLISPVLCKHCQAVIPFEKKRSKFCNHSCSAKFVNKGNTRWRVERKCQSCQSIIPWPKKTKYCIACQPNCVSTPFEKIVQDGTRKHRLIQERGHRCESCKLDTWLDKPIIITLDHIDGNPDNGSKENLRLLCWNCHAMTPTFGFKNAGRFPDNRRRRRIVESLKRSL